MERQFDAPNAVEVSRRDLLVRGLTGAAFGAAALALPQLARAQTGDPESVQVVEIHQLQADFHLAKSTQDIDLMMSLWAADAVFTFKGVTYVGNDAIRALLLTTGSFTHKRLSLVSSFKIQVDVNGDLAQLYYECIDIGDYATSPFVASVLFNVGTVRKINGKWLFWNMNGGSALPLSVDHYYP